MLKKVCPSLVGWERSHPDATLVKFAENLPSGVPKKAIYQGCLSRHTLLQNLWVVGTAQESCCLLLSLGRGHDAAGSPHSESHACWGSLLSCTLGPRAEHSPAVPSQCSLEKENIKGLRSTFIKQEKRMDMELKGNKSIIAEKQKEKTF